MIYYNPKSIEYTHRVHSFILREAHRDNTINSDSQDGSDQMDKRNPVGEKRPEEQTGTKSESIHWNIGVGHKLPKRLRLQPVIVHVFNLLLDEAVNALAVRPVRQASDHTEPVRPPLAGEQLLYRNGDFLTPLVMAGHYFLVQDFRLDQTTVFSFSPSSLQRAGWKRFKQEPSEAS